MDDCVWKVGELARRTGVSVRTLHYYEEIGLLVPSGRTASGYRLYVVDDLLRLQQIKSLRQLGFLLEETRGLLDGGGYAAREVVDMHLGRLEEQLAAQERLRNRLKALRERLGERLGVDADELFALIKEMDMVEKFEKYYTPEQLEYLARRREQVGEERIREVEQEWPTLIADVRAEMAQGSDPAGPRMQELARRWKGLIEEFTGGDPGILQSLKNMYGQEPDIAADKGFSPEPALMEYVGKALAAVPPDQSP